MIYVLRSAAFKGDSDSEFETIIKIGYTDENSKKNRLDLYLTENPTVRVLCLIPNGTKEDERILHMHFNSYRVYGREWFKDVSEIIEFFETHKTSESLSEVDDVLRKLSISENIKVSKNRKENKDKEDIVNSATRIIIKEYSFDINDLSISKRIEKYLWLHINNFWETIEKVVPDCLESIKIAKQDLDELKVKNSILYKFKSEFTLLPNSFEPRMRCIYDYHENYPQLFEQFGDIISTFIPRSYENYINILGFDRMKANGFRELDIIREIESISNLEKAKETNIIESIFSIGSKYTKKEIKKTLREFYKENNISKTPKASDLEEFFELKDCKIKNSEGKWKNGFEIVKRR